MNISTKTKEQRKYMQEIAIAMLDQFEAKNVAYGDSFGRQFEKYGPISGLVRLSDKFSRVESLVLGAENNVSDERLEDTLIDAACYSLMFLYEYRRMKENKS